MLPTSMAHSKPPNAPDQVLFGLTLGINFGPPIALPASKAPVSVAQVIQNKDRISATPSS